SSGCGRIKKRKRRRKERDKEKGGGPTHTHKEDGITAKQDTGMQVSTSGLAIVSCGGMVTGSGADTSTSASTSTKATRTPYSAPLMKFQARVNGRDATVLLDSGSSSNFISAEYA